MSIDITTLALAKEYTNRMVGSGGTGSGVDGGYYTPGVTQPTADTMQISFAPSKSDMPAVNPVTVNLPVSENSGQNVAQDYYLLKSPNGTVWKIVATDAGQLQVVGVADNVPDGLLPGRLLVWSDEFDGDGVDWDKWRSSTNASAYTELAAYTYQRRENAYTENGQLILRAVRDRAVDGYDWTSARIDTLGKFGVKHGRIEAKLKCEGKSGAFPAFWTLGCNSYYPSGENGPYGVTKSWGAPWPYCGEIDIFEGINGYRGVHPVIHYSLSPEVPEQSSESIAQNDTIDTSEYHIYGVEWTENSMSAYLDGEKIGEIDTQGLAPYNKPHYLILNLCIGGIAGSPDEDVDEIKMYVDWVRVYAPEQVTEKLDISGVALSRDSVTMNVGDPAQYVDYTTTPAGTVNGLVTLTSSNPSVFTVYGTKLTPVGAGEAELIATAYNGHTARIPVSVGTNQVIHAESITIDPAQAVIVEGQTLQLNKVVVPNNHNDIILWNSSDNDVATVDGDGLVTGVGSGGCVITAYSAHDNSVSAACNVSVEAIQLLELPSDGLTLQLDKNGMHSYSWINAVDSEELLWKNAYNNSTGEGSAIRNENGAFYFMGSNYKDYSKLDISGYYAPSGNQTLLLSFDSTENGNIYDFVAAAGRTYDPNNVAIYANGNIEYRDGDGKNLMGIWGLGVGKTSMALRNNHGSVIADFLTADGGTKRAEGTLPDTASEIILPFTLGAVEGKGKLVRYKVCAVYDRVLSDDEIASVLATINDFVNG